MRRFAEIPVSRLGLGPPPVVTHLKPIHRPAADWSLLVWSERPAREPLLAWLQPWEPVTLNAPTRANILWLKVRRPPRLWDQLLGSVRVDGVKIDTSGTVRLRVEGPPAAIDQLLFLDSRGMDRNGGRLVRAAADGRYRRLTARQEDALILAVSQGYYDVPRRASQKDIAALLGLSPAACSELLHRAEEVIIRDYTARNLMLHLGP